MGFASVTVEDGVRVTSADVNGFTVEELCFPPRYVQRSFEPEAAYLALVVEGALEKSFPARAMRLERSSAVTVPAGAAHGARFGAAGARIVIVRGREPSAASTPSFRRLDGLRTPELGWIARRLAAELHTTDAAAPLAAEGLALELLATATREADRVRPCVRGAKWLATVEELLRSHLDEPLGLSRLAASVGVTPTHLARTFRAHYGLSVGDFGRRLRLEWAAAELTSGDRPLAAIAADAGFADQSHFTRLFRRHLGTTPARYRAQTSRSFHDA